MYGFVSLLASFSLFVRVLNKVGLGSFSTLRNQHLRIFITNLLRLLFNNLLDLLFITNLLLLLIYHSILIYNM